MNATAKEKSAGHVEVGAGKTAGRALKMVAETGAPGASLMLDGKLGLGALHFVGAGLARAIIGPAGFALVAINSYSKSVTGKHLIQRVRSR